MTDTALCTDSRNTTDRKEKYQKMPFLAIVCPQVGAISETFIRKHIEHLAPSRTVILTGDVLDNSWFRGPVKIIPIKLGSYSFNKEQEQAVTKFLKEHAVTHILCEFGCIGGAIVELNHQKLHLPIYVHFHGQDASEFIRRPEIAAYYKWMGSVVDGVVAVSRPMSNRLAEVGIPKEKISIIHYGVDYESKCTPASQQSPCKFISVSRLVGKKGILFVLQAFEKALKAVPGITLDIIGDGPLRGEIEKHISDHDLMRSVILHGEQSHQYVLDMMNKSSVFIQHSMIDPETGNAEGLPLSILEASAHGLPVISTFHEGIPEAIEHEKTGFLVQERDWELMAEYIIKLANDGDLRKKMGIAGREKILNGGFTVKAMLDELKNFIGLNEEYYCKSDAKCKSTAAAIKRVLFVNHNLYPFEISGTPISTLNHALGIKKKGVEVAILIPFAGIQTDYVKEIKEDYILYKVPKFDKYDAYFGDINNNSLSKYLNSIEKILLDFQPEIVHINDYVFMPEIIVSLFSKRGAYVIRNVCNPEELCHLDSPVYFDGRQEVLCNGPESSEKCAECFLINVLKKKRNDLNLSEKNQYTRKIQRRFESVRSIYQKNVDGVIFTEKSFKDYFTNFISIPDNVTKINPRGFKFDEPRTSEYKKGHSGIIHIGFIGSLIPRKGADLVLKAFEKIAHIENFVLDIYGSDIMQIYLEAISQLAQKYPGKIKFHGKFNNSDLARIASTIDMALVPSSFDTFNRVVRELMYFGVPLIVTDFFGASIIDNDVNGIKIKIGDSDALADSITKILCNPSIIEKLSKGVVATKIESLEEEIDGIYNFYQQIIRNKTAGAYEGAFKDAVQEKYADALNLANAGKHNEAIEALKDIVSVYPDHALAHNDLGVLSFTRGDKDTALAHYRLAVKHDPRNATYLKNLADLLYVSFGNVLEALPIYIDLATRTPEDIEILLALGHVSLAMGKYENAASFYQKVLALAPGNEQATQGIEALERTNKGKTISNVSADPEYQSKLQREISTYEANANVHDLPKIHHRYTREFLSPLLHTLTGYDGHVDWWTAEIDRRAAETNDPVRVLSIGCGNGDMEIEILKRLSRPNSVVLHGIDINDSMIDRARAAATGHGFTTAIFSTQDINRITLKQDYDIVIANHSLHHIVELERLFAEISDHAAPGMRFLINDMIGRNGHRMWNNARPVVEAIWPRLDEKHRFNHHTRTFDAMPLNADFSSAGFEGIRAQDILPLLMFYFDIELFLPFATIINRFTDRAYGHNFDPENAQDVNLILNILSLDVKLLSEKKLAPTQAYISAQKKGSAHRLRYFYQTPAEAIAARDYPLAEADCRAEVDSLTQQNTHQPYSTKLLEGPMVICSIVIPVFNKIEYTKKCIDILQKNTPYGMYEIIVIDNASADGTADYLRGLTQSVRVITNKKNAGFTKACNQGARSARGEFVLFLNNDTEPQPGWLEALIEAAQSDPQAGIIGSKLVYPDGRLQEAGGIIFSDGSGWNYGRFDDPGKPVYNYVREVDYVSGASLMVRHSLLKTIGYFDEQYSPGYYEDTDLCFAARAAGYKVIYTPFSVVVHHEGISSGTDLATGMKQYQIVNRAKFVEKWRDALQRQYSPSIENVGKANERNVIGNILVIDPLLPLFDRASGSLRLFTVVSILRNQGYHLTYIARDGRGQEHYAVILRKMGIEVYATDPDILRTMGHDIPTPRIDLKEILSARRFDIAYLSFYDIALQYLAKIRLFSPSTKIIIDTVDIHFVREKRQAELANDPAALARAETTKLNELSIYSKADLIVTVTEQDWNSVSENLPGKPHFVIPNIHTVHNEAVDIEGRSGIIFVGNFNHLPNIDSVTYFVNEISPIVRKTLPNMTFTIVGNKPPKEISDLQSKNIIITGYVPSTEPYLANARVSVAPLRYGAGMKGKIGEAMALGLPVVTTSIGAEGMGIVHEETAFITDDPQEFARHIIRLCSDNELWRAVSEKGRQFINERFSPEKVALLLDRMINVLANISPLELTAEEKTSTAASGRNLQKGLVSIIILTFNELKYTRECVESIKKHTPEPHEIIFIDNASTDGTVKWLRKISQENKNYKLIENKDNLGFAQGCNQGIVASSGEYILLLNNDVVVTENWLSGMLECLKSTPDAGIVGPMTNNISGPQKVLDVDYKTIPQMIEYAKSFRDRYRHRRVSFRRIVGFCMLLRHTLVDKIGLLDESFGTGNFEDDDYCLRATLAGCRNLIAGDVFIHHYGSRSFIGNRIDYGSSISGNIKIFDEKWTGIDVNTPLGKKVAAFNIIDKADTLYQKGLLDKAIAMFIEGIKYAPEEKAIYYRLAEMLLDAKLYKDALEAVQSMPQEIKADLKRLEIIAYCTEDIEEAGNLADHILSMDKDYAAAMNLKGIHAYKQGDNSVAQDYFRKAITSDPGYGEPYTNLGIMKWAADQKEEALDCLERGFILSPTLTDNVTLYHTAITALEQFDRAEMLFQDAKILHPENKRILFFLIDIFIKQGKFDAAMHKIEQAMLDIGIDDGMLEAALGIREKVGIKEIDKAAKNNGSLSLCMIVKNEEQHLTRCLLSAQPAVDELILVDTGSTDRTKDIARAFGAKVFDFPWTNDFSEARNYSLSKASGDWILVLDADEVISSLDYAAIEKILKKGASRPAAYTLVTRNYTNEVNSKGWIANDRKYLREEAGTGWFPSAKVRLFVNDKRIQFQNPVHEFVEGTLEKAGIEIKASDIPVHHYGRFDRAKILAKGKEYFLLGKKKINQMKDDIKALKELAIQASELGEYVTAVELWKRVIELNPRDSVAFLNIGYAYLKQEKYKEGLVSSRRAMELDPAMKEAVLNYAGSEFIIGDIKKTISVLEKLLLKYSYYPPAMVLIGAAYYVDGQKERSAKLFEKLRKKGFDCTEFFDEQIRAFMSQERYEQAFSLLEAAIKTGNINKDTKTLLAECHSKITTIHA